MEEALRRALTEAVSEVETGADALERIRARIGQRPPRPWLVSVIADALRRVRHWTWRGHWAWQPSLGLAGDGPRALGPPVAAAAVAAAAGRAAA